MEPFSESETEKKDFFNNGVTPVKTDMMFIYERFNYYDSQELDAEFVELKFKGLENSWESDLTFVVVSPKQRNGLKVLKQKISAKNFETAVQSMQSECIRLSLPKFRVESEYDLMKDIKPKPHFLTSSAKFSRLSTSRQIVAQAVHKVFIDVNEKGAEAAAVTAVRWFPLMLDYPLRIVTVNVDHPFLYFIRDKTNGMILFTGQINKL